MITDVDDHFFLDVCVYVYRELITGRRFDV